MMTAAPLPADAGVIVPDMVYFAATAVKSTPVSLAPATVRVTEDGVKIWPLLLGVTTYDPFGTLAKLKFPRLSVTAVALAGPLSVTVAPVLPYEGATVPDSVH